MSKGHYTCTVPGLEAFENVVEDEWIEWNELDLTLRFYLEAHKWPAGPTKVLRRLNMSNMHDELLVMTKVLE